MKQAGKSRKIKITAQQILPCIFIVNLIVTAMVLSLQSRLTATPSSTYDHASYHPGINKKVKSNSIHFAPIVTSPSEKVPFLSSEQFRQKYSEYKPYLPSLDRHARPIDSSCGRPPDYFDFFKKPKSQRSRFFEDKIIYDTFFKSTTVPSSLNSRRSSQVDGSSFSYSSMMEQRPPYGTYVELGAFDGREESNTIFFDQCLGWEGLLIEAQSQNYQKVIENRPNAVKLSFSPTCKEDLDENGRQRTASFYNYPLSNNGMKDLALSYLGKEIVEIPCGSLTTVLNDVFGPNRTISFLSLDVEGAESLVLDTIDFSQVHIDVVMIEIQNSYCPNPMSCLTVHQIRQRMAEANYALLAELVEASDVFVKIGTDAWRRGMSTKLERDRQEWIRKRKMIRAKVDSIGEAR